MTFPSRYDVDPIRREGKKDIVEHIINLAKRLQSKETGIQAGHTAIEDGNFTVRNGDIIVSESDDSIVLRIIHGNVPAIRFTPNGDDDPNRISLFGGDDAEFGIYLWQAVQTHPGALIDGGNIIFGQNYLLLSHWPQAGGGEETFIALNGDVAQANSLIYQGRFANQTQYSNLSGLYVGSFVASSGVSTWTHTYFTPFATTFVPVLTVLHAGSNIQWTLDAQSTSAFTVRFSSTVSQKTINFWGFRL